MNIRCFRFLFFILASLLSILVQASHPVVSDEFELETPQAISERLNNAMEQIDFTNNETASYPGQIRNIEFECQAAAKTKDHGLIIFYRNGKRVSDASDAVLTLCRDSKLGECELLGCRTL